MLPALVSLVFVQQAQASPALVSLDSATVSPGQSVKVALKVTPQAGETVSVLTVDITFDSEAVKPTACEPSQVCNVSFRPGVVRIVQATLVSLSGQVGSVTIQASENARGSSSLGMTIVTCADDRGAKVDCRSQPGTIVIDPAAASNPTIAPPAAMVLPTGFPEGTGRALAPRQSGAAVDALSSASEDEGNGGSSSWWVWPLAAMVGAGATIALVSRVVRRRRDKVG